MSGGGAWKVAYADFVTAMMALFMVLWISAQDKEIVIATSQYFQSPFRAATPATSGVLPFNTTKTSQGKGDDQGTEKEVERDKQIQMTFLNAVAADFYRLLHLDQNLEGKPIDIQVTTDGLRVTLFDQAKRPLFTPGTTELTPWGSFLLQSLAWVIDRHQFNVTIDGHASTSSAALEARKDYSLWELSSDRANVTRRMLVHYAVAPKLIERVTGYADTKPLPNEQSGAATHDRVTLNLTLTANNRFKDGKLVDKHVAIVESENSTP